MATRVTKPGNTREFAQATQPWHIADLDSDLDAIFGSIDNTNIAGAANIATSKLATDAGIVTGMLQNGAVTTAKLADQNVTTAKLALGAAVNNFVQATPSATSVNIVETAVATLPVFTPRGGRVFLFGAIGWYVDILGAATQQSVTMKLYRNTAGAGFVAVANAVWTFTVRASSATEVAYPLPTPFWTEVPSAATQIYELRVVTSSNASPVVLVFTDATNPGRFFAVELA